MEITDNLLAAYAEGSVSLEERMAVRKYLTEHPEELESIIIMMDRNYELGTDLPRSDVPFGTLITEMLEEVGKAEPIGEDACGFPPITEKGPQDMKDRRCEYSPHPIDLSDVEIPDDLLELREAIAEQAHEVWALNRKKQGWTYGPERNDGKKQHPDMMEYNSLPETEKLLDREMAINTIKLVIKLGWDIVRRK